MGNRRSQRSWVKKMKKTKKTNSIGRKEKLARLDRFIWHEGDFIIIKEVAAEKEKKTEGKVKAGCEAGSGEPRAVRELKELRGRKRQQEKNKPRGKRKKAEKKGNK